MAAGERYFLSCTFNERSCGLRGGSPPRDHTLSCKFEKKGRIFSAPTGSPPLPPPHALPSQHPSVASHRLHQTFNPNSIRPSAFPLLLPPSFPSLRYIPSLFLSFHSHLPNLASLHPCISIPRNCPGRDCSDLPGSSSDSLVMFSISPPPPSYDSASDGEQ